MRPILSMIRRCLPCLVVAFILMAITGATGAPGSRSGDARTAGEPPSAAVAPSSGGAGPARLAPPAPRTAVLACPPCDDLDACTVDSCDETTGTCRHDALACDDGNPCTADRCQSEIHNHQAVGGCFHTPLSGTVCDDGNPCTLSESCQTGACVPSGYLAAGDPCDDRNACTVNDACDADDHCVGNPLPAGSVCDDGNACTSDDQCVTTEAGAPRCEGTARACADGDPCTQDLCDPATGQCAHPPVDCNDGNVCTTDVCDPATGLCRRDNVPDGNCSDGNFCTVGDACVGGNCVPGSPNACDDGMACTSDVCDTDMRMCRHFPGSSCCPPDGQCYGYTWDIQQNRCVLYYKVGDDCTAPGSCAVSSCNTIGVCQGRFLIPCDDGNPCTSDTCPGKVCTHTPMTDGTSCGSLNPCDAPGLCQAGACVRPGPQCDDHNPCTTDTCVGGVGCANVPVTGGACDDGDACTSGTTCVQGRCTHGAPLSCDDGNICTFDVCDATAGCHNLVQPMPQTCGTGACERSVDLCEGGVFHDCVPGEPAPEVCNGLDDDCDGLVDENGLVATCAVRPGLLLLPMMSSGGFTVACTFRDHCHDDVILPASGAAIERTWVSAADRLFMKSDDHEFPDPSTFDCPDPVKGYAFEPGLAEDASHRLYDAGGGVVFNFDVPWDGNCLTRDGSRDNLVELTSALPSGALVRVCVAGRFNGIPFEGCGRVLLLRR